MKVKVNAAAENTHTAAGTSAAMIADAKNRLSPLLDQGHTALTPLLDTAKLKGAEYAAGAAQKLAPARAVAQQRYEEMLPRLGEALEQLVNDENAQSAQNRGLAALAALRGELELPKKERKRIHKEQLRQVRALQKQAKKQQSGGALAKSVKTTGLLAILGALGYFLWKQFGSQGSTSDWQAHNASAHRSTSTPSSTQTFSEPVDAPQSEAGVTVDRSKYGDDAFVGSEPPAGFTIKGNERSMKFHTPDSGGYERTIADVWFTSEEAAEKAGFTRAQR